MPSPSVLVWRDSQFMLLCHSLIFWIIFCNLVVLVKYTSRFSFCTVLFGSRQFLPTMRSALPFLVRGYWTSVFFTTLVIGISTGPCVTHLQELARHIHTHKISACFIFVKYTQNLFGRHFCLLRSCKPPIR